MTAPTGGSSTRFSDKYVIERELGRGATAIVYLARDVDLNRYVALKVLREELTEGVSVERFTREISLTAQLHHSHIVPVLHSGTHDGRLFFALPYMDGGTLRERLDRDRQLPLADVLSIGRGVASALAFAHARNLLHRDVKPENILFTNGQACLSDFGIARVVEDSNETRTTSTGLVRGTPAYMSPEQAAGEREFDGRSDMYSLACVLYEAAAGVPAFVAANARALIAQRITHAPRPVRVYRPTVPESLEQVLQKALAVSPADRFRDMDEFVSALDAVDLSIPVRPRAHHRLSARGVTLGVAGVLAIVTGIVVARKEVEDRVGSALDSTRVAVLPVEVPDTTLAKLASAAVYRGISGWRGISTVDQLSTSDFAQRHRSPSASDQQAFARGQRAGRLVRTRIAKAANTWEVASGIYETATLRPISEQSYVVRGDLSDSLSTLERVAASLMVDGADPRSFHSSVLPAVQSFAKAMRLLSTEWNLRAADSLLSHAIELDPSFARASLWLAEVRVANGAEVSRWGPAAARATRDSLSEREGMLRDALVALAGSRFPDACRSFDAMRASDTTDFVAWFGLGQCRSLDSIVVRDARSPSGWSFRSSRFRAAESFAHAFLIAPALHPGLESGGYLRVRSLIFARELSGSTGISISRDTVRFASVPELQSDTLSFVPYPRNMVGQGVTRSDARARALAFERQRNRFSEIARVWSAALPNSPGTKEAVTIALAIDGNRAALDTLAAARRLAKDEISRLQLAAEDVFLRLQFVRLTDTLSLSAIVGLADSLLSSSSGGGSQAQSLASVAAVIGRCERAAALIAENDRNSTSEKEAVVDSISILAALGCPVEISPAVTRSVASRFDTTAALVARREYDAFGRAVSLMFPRDSARITALAAVSGDYLLRAEVAALRHDPSAVREILDRQRTRRGDGIRAVSADTRLVEAELWLAIGDTATARDWTSSLLQRSDWFTTLPYRPILIGAQIRGAALAARLRANDPEARSWLSALSLLWKHADPAARAALSHR